MRIRYNFSYSHPVVKAEDGTTARRFSPDVRQRLQSILTSNDDGHQDTQLNDNTFVHGMSALNTETGEVKHVSPSVTSTPQTEADMARGKLSREIFAQEHPYLNAAGTVAGALPFVVAATPVMDAAAATTAGTAITNGLTWFNPYLDALTTSYFTAHGVNDIAHGKIRPETVLELIPGYKLIKPINHLATNIYDYFNLSAFINRYGYKYRPKFGLIFDDKKLDRLTQQLVKQHNTFARGVDVTEARKYYGFPQNINDEDIARYTLTHAHSPSKANAGGNPDLKPVLYTSNSLDLAKVYTNGKGYVGILQRPLTYSPNRSEMLKLNDFRFYRNPASSNGLSATTDEPYILRPGERPLKKKRNKGMYAIKRKNKVIQKFEPVAPTGHDALAHQGSELFSMRRPDDVDFRHYLFMGDEGQPLLRLKYMFKNNQELPVTDFSKHSVGFSKKKGLGGTL